MTGIPVVEEPPDLFAIGQECFREYARQLAHHGIPLPRTLGLERGDGMLCYYKAEAGTIYLSVPAPDDPKTPIYMMFMGSILSAPDQESLERFLGLFVPRVVAHELGHAVRDQHGRFGTNLWEEEQIANQLAVALQNRQLTPDDRRFFQEFVDRAMVALVQRVGSIDKARGSYLDQLEAMVQAGEIGTSTMMSLEALAGLLDVRADELLPEQVSTGAQAGLALREETIDEFNERYMDNQLQYFYFQIGWLQIDLAARHTRYLPEFARDHLGVDPPLLPPLTASRPASTDTALACHEAYLRCSREDTVLARYFYKRYRAELIRLLQGTAMGPHGTASAFGRDSTFLLEAWETDRSDRLDHLSAVAPPELLHLFPGRMRRAPVPGPDPATHLPEETDRALWALTTQTEPQGPARETRDRLALVDRAQVFRTLPARVSLDLARAFIDLPLRAGEPLMWQGDRHLDVCIVSSGTLQWTALGEDGATRSGLIDAGGVVGEIAFLTEQPRTATVTAVGPARCFVIKAEDLRLLTNRHPSIMEHIAAALAERLAAMTTASS